MSAAPPGLKRRAAPAPSPACPRTRRRAALAVPVARALDLVGDKWTLLVIRDLMFGARTYGDLLKSPEAIPTNLLADRLKRLVAWELVEKRPYQAKPVRYEYVLTESGWGLRSVMKSILDWSQTHLTSERLTITLPKRPKRTAVEPPPE